MVAKKSDTDLDETLKQEWNESHTFQVKQIGWQETFAWVYIVFLLRCTVPIYRSRYIRPHSPQLHTICRLLKPVKSLS